MVPLHPKQLFCQGAMECEIGRQGCFSSVFLCLGEKGEETAKSNRAGLFSFCLSPTSSFPPAHFILGLEHKKPVFKVLSGSSVSRFNQVGKVEPVPLPVSGSNEIASIPSCWVGYPSILKRVPTFPVVRRPSLNRSPLSNL